jgi:hypothetical protein
MMCFVVLAKRYATDVPELAHAAHLAFEGMTQEQAAWVFRAGLSSDYL